jgi:signal transduction histidine kinase
MLFFHHDVLLAQSNNLATEEQATLNEIEKKMLAGDTTATSYIDSVLQILYPDKQKPLQIALYKKKAEILESNNRFHLSAEALEDGWLIAKDFHMKDYMSLFFPYLPKAMWRSGNYAKAIKYYIFLENNYTLLEDSSILYSIYNDNGLIYHRLNYPKKAEEYYLKAIKFSKQRGSQKMLGVSLTNLGALYYDTDRYRKSLSLFLQGVKIEEETKQKEKAGRSYTYIAKNYLALEDTVETRMYLQKALRRNENTQDLFGLARTYIAWANYFNKVQHQPQKAINRLNDVIEITQKAGLKEEEKQAWQALADLYNQEMHYDSAFRALQHEYAISMELSDIEEAFTSQKLNYQLELEQKANQIHQLNLSRQQSRTKAYAIGTMILILLLSIISWLYYKNIRSKRALIIKNRETESQRTELQKLNQKLVKAYGEIDKANTLKTQFLNNISHEIRTPLNGILGFSSMIATDNLSKSERQEYYKMIELNSSALLQSIDDIVNMALISSKEVKVQKSQIDINSLVDEIFELFKVERAFVNKHQVMIRPVKLDSNQILISDAGKLRTILTKLLDNAIKFTKEGEITFGCFPHEHAIEWFVKDTGIGIPKEHHDRIFEKFYQIQHTTTRNFEGSGLGLTIASNYVNLLGGHMWFNSTPGKGSNFHFTIPKNQELNRVNGPLSASKQTRNLQQ